MGWGDGPAQYCIHVGACERNGEGVFTIDNTTRGMHLFNFGHVQNNVLTH